MKSRFIDWGSSKLFSYVHGNNLVYNSCWEDPRLDREAMNLRPHDDILMITSAGCNALDYALDTPNSITCVDVNPAQTALLELKVAAIRELDFETFFEIFGYGNLPEFADIYRRSLRPRISKEAQSFWDERIHYFSGVDRKASFYFQGTSGLFAYLLSFYIGMKRVHGVLHDMFQTEDIDEQQRLYNRYIKDVFWTSFSKSIMKWDATLALLGVPRPQRRQIDQTYHGGVAQFTRDCIESVFTRLPLQDNYFWWLYVTGRYEKNRCPEYLKEANFNRLKSGLVDKIQWKTSTINQHLNSTEDKYSKFVLLDHMDWLSFMKQDELKSEWQNFIDHSTGDAQFLWRSAGLYVDFIDPILVNFEGAKVPVGEMLKYDRDLSKELHQKDRVHTYGNFYIANRINH